MWGGLKVGLGGCSSDASVGFVRSVSRSFVVSFFDFTPSSSTLVMNNDYTLSGTFEQPRG